jgi:hypothetical protein
MIDARWPVVRESYNSREKYEDYGNVELRHRVLRPCGFEVEGLNCDKHPLIFTEEHAIRALWFRYMELTPPSDFEVDTKPVLFVWREFPETNLMHGIWSARMRYSCLWRDRFNELTPLERVGMTIAA